MIILRNILRFALAFILLTYISCEGPEGPEGPSGPAGQNGVAGEDGAPGIDGNAIVTSIIYDISDQGGQEFISLDVPQLTEQVLGEDLILVYLRYASNQPFEWILIPGRNYSGDHILLTKFIVGEILIEIRTVDGLGTLANSGDYDRAKVIIAKASTVETGKRSVDFEDYHATMDFYGLNYN